MQSFSKQRKLATRSGEIARILEEMDPQRILGQARTRV